MGLAASQARFLAITARKADCEFRSMQIAQNKLSVTREMEQATQDYQNAINATKMVWDYDGEQSFMTDISYGFLMSPSYLNNFNPYLITNRGGQVIVDSKVASAAKRAGIDPNKGGNRTAGGFALFVSALYEEGFISEGSMRAVKSYVFPGPDYSNAAFDSDGNYIYVDDKGKTIDKYNSNAGYGAEPMGKNEYIDTGIRGLAQRLKNTVNESADITTTQVTSTHQETNTQISLDGKNAVVGGHAAGTHFVVNGVTKTQISLSDILTGDVCMVSTLADGQNTYDSNNNDVAMDGITDDVSRFFKNAVTNIAMALGYKQESDWPDAFTAAYNFTVKQYGISENYKERTEPIHIGTAGNSSTLPNGQTIVSCAGVTDVQKAVEKAANVYNGIVWRDQPYAGTDYNAAAAINLSHLFGYFLTAFDSFTTGFDSNYVLDEHYDDSFFVTSDPNFRFAVLAEGTETDETVMKADFYMQLYNNLCVNGYVKNDEVKDNKYLEQMLKNGVYYMCGVNEQDGYFYQARYNDDVRTLIKVVNDEDAKTRAESEYSYKKMRLTAKEDRLDLEMKNIDMEIASLTSEYDSVKNLISKSVEKTFKQFES